MNEETQLPFQDGVKNTVATENSATVPNTPERLLSDPQIISVYTAYHPMMLLLEDWLEANKPRYEAAVRFISDTDHIPADKLDDAMMFAVQKDNPVDIDEAIRNNAHGEINKENIIKSIRELGGKGATVANIREHCNELISVYSSLNEVFITTFPRLYKKIQTIVECENLV